MKALLVAEHHDGRLSQTTACALTAACECANEVTVLLAAETATHELKEQLKLRGVSAILVVEHPQFATHLAEPWAKLIAHIAVDFTHIIMAHSSFGKDVLPRAAALSDALAFADVIAIDGPKTFKRPCYAGDIIECIKSLQDTQWMTVRATAFDVAEKTEAEITVETPVLEVNFKSAASFVSKEKINIDKPSLSSASIVFSGGRGMQTVENFNRLEKIAAHYQAAVGASRAAVDAGLIANEAQVGQTGQIVAPDIYVALGISGATQHLAGMKDSKIVVAINKDSDAPIFEVANYGLKANIEDVLDEWERAIV